MNGYNPLAFAGQQGSLPGDYLRLMGQQGIENDSQRNRSRLITLRELEALRVALTEWRAILQRRFGWRIADSAYVRHGAILSAALMGSEV